MQRLRGDLVVVNHGDADVIGAGIAAVGLFAREIAPGHHAQAGLAPQPQRCRLAAAASGHVEPQKKAAGRTMIVVTVADDLDGGSRRYRSGTIG